MKSPSTRQHAPVIKLDARMYGHPGGIGRYLRELVGFFAEQPIDTASFHSLMLEPEQFSVSKPIPPGADTEHTSVEVFSPLEQIRLPLFARGADLLHAPNFNAPLWTPQPLVVTIHDLTLLKFPDLLPHSLARYYVQTLMHRAVSSAERVIAVSKNTKRDLLEAFDVPAEKIDVVYNGVGSEFEPVREPERLAEVRDKYDIEGPYLFSLGNLKKHKNLERTVEAFGKARRQHPDLSLVISGKGAKFESELRQLVDELDITDDVCFAGYIADEDLAAIYSDAEAFVYTSIYEGFGIPPLEAMACRTPVVTSNCSSIPEVVGDAAIQVDPYDVEAIAAGIDQLLNDPHTKRDLADRGQDRSARFSWKKTARRTLETYESVLKDTAN